MIATVSLSALALAAASLAGSVAGLFLKNIPHKWNDVFLGFCAGMMLAAAVVCLMLEGITMAPGWDIWQVLAGVVAGVALIAAIDVFTPHIHHLAHIEGAELEPHRRGESPESVHRILLFTLAIAIHKFPEGVATGVTFPAAADLATATSMDNAMSLTTAIAIQNIPEGIVVVTPLLLIGVGRLRALLVGLAIAGIEIAGVYTGFYLGTLSAALLPALLGLAGGAMLYVLSDEMIPETHAHGFQRQATYALVAGVACLLFLQQTNWQELLQ